MAQLPPPNFSIISARLYYNPWARSDYSLLMGFSPTSANATWTERAAQRETILNSVPFFDITASEPTTKFVFYGSYFILGTSKFNLKRPILTGARYTAARHEKLNLPQYPNYVRLNAINSSGDAVTVFYFASVEYRSRNTCVVRLKEDLFQTYLLRAISTDGESPLIRLRSYIPYGRPFADGAFIIPSTSSFFNESLTYDNVRKNQYKFTNLSSSIYHQIPVSGGTEESNWITVNTGNYPQSGALALVTSDPLISNSGDLPNANGFYTYFAPFFIVADNTFGTKINLMQLLNAMSLTKFYVTQGGATTQYITPEELAKLAVNNQNKVVSLSVVPDVGGRLIGGAVDRTSNFFYNYTTKQMVKSGFSCFQDIQAPAALGGWSAPRQLIVGTQRGTGSSAVAASDFYALYRIPVTHRGYNPSAPDPGRYAERAPFDVIEVYAMGQKLFEFDPCDYDEIYLKTSLEFTPNATWSVDVYHTGTSLAKANSIANGFGLIPIKHICAPMGGVAVPLDSLAAYYNTQYNTDNLTLQFLSERQKLVRDQTAQNSISRNVQKTISVVEKTLTGAATFAAMPTGTQSESLAGIRLASGGLDGITGLAGGVADSIIGYNQLEDAQALAMSQAERGLEAKIQLSDSLSDGVTAGGNALSYIATGIFSLTAFRKTLLNFNTKECVGLFQNGIPCDAVVSSNSIFTLASASLSKNYIQGITPEARRLNKAAFDFLQMALSYDPYNNFGGATINFSAEFSEFLTACRNGVYILP